MADRFRGMEFAPSSSDLIEGLDAIVTGRGFVSGLDDPRVLTDGKANGGGKENMVICADSQDSQDVGSSTTLTYTLSSPKDIGIIRVFSSNIDVRAFQSYDVDVSTDKPEHFERLATDVRAGNIGDAYSGEDNLSAITEIKPESGRLLATKVRMIRFTFWAVGNPFAGQRVTRREKGIDGSALFEIDVLPPPPSNVDADIPISE